MPADSITECITRVVEKTAGLWLELAKGFARNAGRAGGGAYRYGVRPVVANTGRMGLGLGGLGVAGYATSGYWGPHVNKKVNDAVKERVPGLINTSENQQAIRGLAKDSLGLNINPPVPAETRSLFDVRGLRDDYLRSQGVDIPQTSPLAPAKPMTASLDPAYEKAVLDILESQAAPEAAARIRNLVSQHVQPLVEQAGRAADPFVDRAIGKADDRLTRRVEEIVADPNTPRKLLATASEYAASPAGTAQAREIADSPAVRKAVSDVVSSPAATQAASESVVRYARSPEGKKQIDAATEPVLDSVVRGARNRLEAALPKFSPATLGALAVGVPTLAGLAFSRPGRRKRGLGRGLAVGLGTLAGGAVARATGGPTPGIGRTALGAGIGALAGHLAGGALAGPAGDDREGG